jgi:hypothetical protein
MPVASEPAEAITLGGGSTPVPPVVTAIFFQGGDLKIRFSPGGSGYILMSSNDLVAPSSRNPKHL